ncbi:MAG: hypothetical protein L6R00_19220 [Phycisphaerae bacterium]|nr:hypothetical protein [Phycisphaerae bacterium]
MNIRRFVLVLLPIILVVGAMAARRTAHSGMPPAYDAAEIARGRALRQALGYGPRELAALGVSSAAQVSLANAAIEFGVQNSEQVDPLLAALDAARRAAFREYERDGDAAAADEAVQSALTPLVSACGSAIESMNAFLSTPQAVMQARLSTNSPLAAPLGLLDVSDDQRAALTAAQRQRDAVSKNHRLRKDPGAVEDARTAFAAAVDGLLTEEQRQEHDSLQASLAANLAEAMQTEDTVGAGAGGD